VSGSKLIISSYLIWTLAPHCWQVISTII
jgi:hypothetical protein